MTTITQSKSASDAQALDGYLRMLAGPAPGARLLEIRFALRYRDMGRLFIAANSAPGASRLIRRLAEHQAGRGARLLQVITQAGIEWTLARTWQGTRERERQLKRQGGASRRCPICRAHRERSR